MDFIAELQETHAPQSPLTSRIEEPSEEECVDEKSASPEFGSPQNLSIAEAPLLSSSTTSVTKRDVEFSDRFQKYTIMAHDVSFFRKFRGHGVQSWDLVIYPLLGLSPGLKFGFRHPPKPNFCLKNPKNGLNPMKLLPFLSKSPSKMAQKSEIASVSPSKT